jgi:hypothetical protein
MATLPIAPDLTLGPALKLGLATLTWLRSWLACADAKACVLRKSWWAITLALLKRCDFDIANELA